MEKIYKRNSIILSRHTRNERKFKESIPRKVPLSVTCAKLECIIVKYAVMLNDKRWEPHAVNEVL